MPVSTEERIKRLNGFTGKLKRNWSSRIARFIVGKTVLEIGCGYGTLVTFLKKRNYDVVGIDKDPQTLKVANRIYGDINVKVADVYELPFSQGEFDTVILQESAHHLDFDRALREIDRVCNKEIIIFDPNPNFILKLGRKIIGHLDPEAKIEDIKRTLESAEYKIRHIEFSDVFTLPLTGGLVGPRWFPEIGWLQDLMLKFDSALNLLLRRLSLQKLFCWRYLIIATKNSNSR